MRIVYAIHAELKPRAKENTKKTIERIKGHINDWVSQKYAKVWKTSIACTFENSVLTPLPKHKLFSSHWNQEEIDLIHFDWTHPDDDPGAAWQTTIVLGRNRDAIDLAVTTKFNTTIFKPISIGVGRPRIVDQIMSICDFSVNNWPLDDSPREISANEVEQFVKTVMCAKERAIPIVLISTDLYTDKPLVSPEQLFNRLKGFAHVVVLNSKWASFKLSEIIGKELSCFGGAVRLYWPGFDIGNARPFDHRLYNPMRLKYLSAKNVNLDKIIFNNIAAISGFNSIEGESIRFAREAMASEDRAAIARQISEIKNRQSSIEDLETQVLNCLDQISLLKKENEDLRNDLAVQRSSWSDFQRLQSEVEDGTELLEAEPSNVYEALIQVKSRERGGTLIFLDSAIDSAQGSPYKNPGRVKELLEAISLVAGEWHQKNGVLGQSWEKAFNDLGFDYKDKISQTSKGKWRADYEFLYEGEKIIFENHITIGSGQPDTCLSVHWYRDDKRKCIVLGHCGRHLTNTST